MTMNDRPIDDPTLQTALNEVKAVMARHGLAGACMLVAKDEAAFAYRLHAPWSAIQSATGTPLGWRIYAKSAVHGAEGAHTRLEGAVHTVCQLSDFGEQTTAWMEDVKLMLRRSGIDFEHTPFNGKPLAHIEQFQR